VLPLGTRPTLPRLTNRLCLGSAGLLVSPICLGIVGTPNTVLAAFDAGINFFFVTADLHWPIYEPLRQGLVQLLARSGDVRDNVVVGVVSYLEQPFFNHLQLHEVIDCVPGLRRVDLIIAGGVCHIASLQARSAVLQEAKLLRHCGAQTIGASFHDHCSARASFLDEVLDINYVRYNPAHTGAAVDVFPHLRSHRTALLYGFKSVLFSGSPSPSCTADNNNWLPKPTDYYRFALSNNYFDGILCCLGSPHHVHELAAAIDDGPLTTDQQIRMVTLS
jgi:hypothetical protein